MGKGPLHSACLGSTLGHHQSHISSIPNDYHFENRSCILTNKEAVDVCHHLENYEQVLLYSLVV